MTHELNNLLQAVTANLEGMRRLAGDRPEIAHRIDITLDCVNRIAGLIAAAPDRFGPVASARTATPVTTSSDQPLRIVVTEDDALVRMTVAGLLEEMGYTVIEAATGEEALKALTEPADMLITDLHLPDMNGDVLAEIAQDRQPGLAVVIASGDERDATSRHIWLQKPFNSVRLRDAVKAAHAAA